MEALAEQEFADWNGMHQGQEEMKTSLRKNSSVKDHGESQLPGLEIRPAREFG